MESCDFLISIVKYKLDRNRNITVKYKERSDTNLDITVENVVHVQVFKSHKKLNEPLTKFLQSNGFY